MKTPPTNIQLINEPVYTFCSRDNLRNYQIEIDLSGGYKPSSIHGLLIDDQPAVVAGDARGTSGVNSNSLLVLEPYALFVVGAHVICYSLEKKLVEWTLKIDEATCFGIYYAPSHDALISHGELSICRFSMDGEILWSSGGSDIFSEGFQLLAHAIEAIDFDQKVYYLDYDSGHTPRKGPAKRL